MGGLFASGFLECGVNLVPVPHRSGPDLDDGPLRPARPGDPSPDRKGSAQTCRSDSPSEFGWARPCVPHSVNTESVNTEMVHLDWLVGHAIIEQQEQRAGCAEPMLASLAQRPDREFAKVCTSTNPKERRPFSRTDPKGHPPERSPAACRKGRRSG